MQLKALAEAGYHAVAPDMRGYGETDRPEEIEKYTILHLVGDMVGVVDVLGAERAVIVEHTWRPDVALAFIFRYAWQRRKCRSRSGGTEAPAKQTDILTPNACTTYL